MADEEKDLQKESAQAEAKVKEKADLKDILGVGFVGYELVKDHLSHFKSQDGLHIEGVKFLDPKNESFNKFLTSDEFKDRRNQLKQRLQVWAEQLGPNDVTSDEFKDKLDNMIRSGGQESRREHEEHSRNDSSAGNRLSAASICSSRTLRRARIRKSMPISPMSVSAI